MEGMNSPLRPTPRTKETGTAARANRPMLAVTPLTATACPARAQAACDGGVVVQPAARSSRQRVTTSRA